MPQSALIYRVLVASPSDCVHERKAIPEVISLWNALNSLQTAAILEPVLWETHARPELGERPQAIVNKQIVQRCDLLVGAFWTKLGTHTGQAESGTAEEIEEFRTANKPVLLYFSNAPVILDSVDEDQYRRLREYREKMKREGIVFNYESIAEFRELLLRHLTATIGEVHTGTLVGPPAPATETAHESDEYRAIRIFKSNFAAFLRRLSAEWSSERDSEPYSADEGRSIMRSARAEVLNFKSQVVSDPDGQLTTALDEALKRIRQLERHEIMIDGGISWAEFWAIGDSVIDALQSVDAALEKV